MMIPTNVVILITVNQYSISPYRRTLKLLNSKGMMRNTMIQISGGYLSFGSQNCMIFCAATSCVPNPMTYANQYDHPVANPYKSVNGLARECTIAGDKQRLARVTNPPGIGKKLTISPSVIYRINCAASTVLPKLNTEQFRR